MYSSDPFSDKQFLIFMDWCGSTATSMPMLLESIAFLDISGLNSGLNVSGPKYKLV